QLGCSPRFRTFPKRTQRGHGLAAGAPVDIGRDRLLRGPFGGGNISRVTDGTTPEGRGLPEDPIDVRKPIAEALTGDGPDRERIGEVDSGRPGCRGLECGPRGTARRRAP